MWAGGCEWVDVGWRMRVDVGLVDVGWVDVGGCGRMWVDVG